MIGFIILTENRDKSQMYPALAKAKSSTEPVAVVNPHVRTGKGNIT